MDHDHEHNHEQDHNHDHDAMSAGMYFNFMYPITVLFKEWTITEEGGWYNGYNVKQGLLKKIKILHLK